MKLSNNQKMELLAISKSLTNCLTNSDAEIIDGDKIAAYSVDNWMGDNLGYEWEISFALPTKHENEYIIIFNYEDCYAAKVFSGLAVCEDCGNIEDEDEMGETEGGATICKTCQDSGDYCVCEHCGRYTDVVYSVSGRYGEEFICGTCLDNNDNISRCRYCGEYFDNRFTGYQNGYGEAICETCLDSGNYAICDVCGEIMDFDEAVYTEDGCYCRSCAPNRVEYVRPHFYDLRKNKKECSFGVEIECGTNSYGGEEYNYFYPTYDGSINDFICPVEYVSDIFSLRELENCLNEELENIEENYTANSSCGLHVHAGREFFSPLSKEKIRLLIHNNYKSLCKFARRSPGAAADWAADSYARAERETYGLGYHKKDKLKYRTGSRYEALNDTNRNTFELRIFSGSTKVLHVKAAVYFFDALREFANTKNFIEVNKAALIDVIKAYTNKKGKQVLTEYWEEVMKTAL